MTSAQPPARFSWQVNDASAAAGPAGNARRQQQQAQKKQKQKKNKKQQQRQQQKQAKTKSEGPSTNTDAGSGEGTGRQTSMSLESGDSKAQTKKNLQRDSSNEARVSDAASQAGDPTNSSSGWRVFVGQLPFYLTDDRCIRKHFTQAGCSVAGVRMLSDKNTKKFRGVAFVELSDKDSLTIALKLHHTRLGHKKIVVELSAGGGGNSTVRKQKIQKKRERLNAQAEATRLKRQNRGRDANAVPVGHRPEQ